MARLSTRSIVFSLAALGTGCATAYDPPIGAPDGPDAYIVGPEAPEAPLPPAPADAGLAPVPPKPPPPDAPGPDAAAPPEAAPEDAGSVAEPPALAPDAGGLPPPEDFPDEPRDDGPCQGLDALGECVGSVLRYCDDGFLVIWDCAWMGQSCGWVDDRQGYDCGAAGDRPPPGEDGPAPPDAPPPPADPGDCGRPVEAQVVELVNASRAQYGLGALGCDAAAIRAAQLHSEDQCQMGRMSHTGSDGSDPGERMRRAGGQFGGWGENVAYGASAPGEVHEMWMNSPGHRANILGSFGRIGVGLSECGGGYFWTETFMD